MVDASRSKYCAGATRAADKAGATSRKQFSSILCKPSALQTQLASTAKTHQSWTVSPMMTTITSNPCHGVRDFSSSSSLTEAEIRKRLDEFQDLFVEARLCIEDVNESAGTKYFDDDAEEAQRAVDEAVSAFTGLVDEIEDLDEKNRILRGNG